MYIYILYIYFTYFNTFHLLYDRRRGHGPVSEAQDKMGHAGTGRRYDSAYNAYASGE